MALKRCTNGSAWAVGLGLFAEALAPANRRLMSGGR